MALEEAEAEVEQLSAEDHLEINAVLRVLDDVAASRQLTVEGGGAAIGSNTAAAEQASNLGKHVRLMPPDLLTRTFVAALGAGVRTEELADKLRARALEVREGASAEELAKLLWCCHKCDPGAKKAK